MTWYDDAVRTIIELPEPQIQALAAYCAREKVSRAEAIRRAVKELVTKSERQCLEDEAAFKAAFGMWKDRGIDGVEYQRQLRAEWDRD
jgi:metal-responsive CopG/Arc/MetJ family transcriptional regulator